MYLALGRHQSHVSLINHSALEFYFLVAPQLSYTCLVTRSAAIGMKRLGTLWSLILFCGKVSMTLLLTAFNHFLASGVRL